MARKLLSFALLCCAAAAVHAQSVITPKVVGTTATQAVLAWTAPDTNACSVAVSEQPGFSPLVPDVDPGLFAGANLDSRQADINSGTQRVFVVGRRRADQATDGKLYSRALQVATQHYFQVTCGSVVASGSFTTRNLPVGDTFPENPPFNSAGFGNYGWPTLDWSDHSKTYVDPMTGVLLKPATYPGDWSQRSPANFGSDFWVDATGHWTNPASAVSGVSSTLATYSGAGNEALFVGIDPAATSYYGGEPPELGNGWYQDYFNPEYSLDDLGIHLIGSGTDASAANRTVAVCISIDSGQTCLTNSINIVLGTGAAADSGAQPTVFPKPLFGGWGKALARSDLPTIGTVSVSGNLVTQTAPLDGRGFFSSTIPAGSKIRIAGSAPACAHNLCTVTKVLGSTTLTIAESVQLTNAAFTLANLGFRIVKTSAVGSVSFTASYEYAASNFSVLPVSSIFDICSHTPVTVSVDASGNPLPGGKTLTGYSCIINRAWYWIDTTSGESRMISIGIPPSAPAFQGWDPRDIPGGPNGGYGNIVFFGTADPSSAYASLPLAAGGVSLFRLTYTGDYRAHNYAYQPNTNGLNVHNTVPDNITWTNLTPPSRQLDIQSQITANFPAFDPVKYGSGADFIGVSGNYALFLHQITGQNGACWIFLLNIQTGKLEQGFNSWDGAYDPIFRWSGCHTMSPGTIPNTGIMITNGLHALNSAVLYGGPFQSAILGVYRNGSLSQTTSLPSDSDGTYDAACPTDLATQWISAGATGNACLTIRVQGEPCSAFASAQEAAWAPCPWDGTRSMLQTMAEGDLITDGSPNPDGSLLNDYERLRIVRKTPVANGQFDLVMQRNASQFCGSAAYQRVHANGWPMIMAAGGQWTCDGSLTTIDILNRKAYGENRFLVLGHAEYGAGALPGTATLVGQAQLPDGSYGYSVRANKPLSAIGSAADRLVSYDPHFSGVVGLPFSDIQSFASKSQWTAGITEQRWALDFRYISGGSGLAFEVTNYQIAPNTATLVPGTTSVYQVSSLTVPKVKSVPLLAFAGRWLLSEQSGPATGDTLTDANPWRFCYAYKAGECRHDSTIGNIYMVVPAATITGACQASQYARNIPCVLTNHPLGAWGDQFDITGSNPVADAQGTGTRRLTMGFSGPFRQYAYGNMHPLPDGKWAFISGWYVDGMMVNVMLVKLPPFRTIDSAVRNDFVPVTVKIGAFASAVRAAVDFGYGEYGNPSDFHCTPRAELCSAMSATLNTSSPFVYASEGNGGAACRAGCTITIPALPARILYYRIRYTDANGNTVVAGPVQILASPEEPGTAN